MQRPSRCLDCGKDCTPDGHHPDYTKPRFVLWLCKSCHRRLHATRYHIGIVDETAEVERHAIAFGQIDLTFSDYCDRAGLVAPKESQ